MKQNAISSAKLLKRMFYISAVAGTVFISACNNDKDISMNQPVDAVGAAMNPDSSSRPVNDSAWVIKAYESSMQEVELSDHVKNQLSNKNLQKLAEMMVNDHRRINSELKALADQKKIPLPDGATKNDVDDFMRRNTQNGKPFDKAYLDKLVDDHNKAVDLFTSISQKAGDKDIRDFFQQHVDQISHHLYMANALRDSVMSKDVRQQ